MCGFKATEEGNCFFSEATRGELLTGRSRYFW